MIVKVYVVLQNKKDILGEKKSPFHILENLKKSTEKKIPGLMTELNKNI